jgi:hypothetical protein
MSKPKAEMMPLFGKYDGDFIAVIFLGCRGLTREKADKRRLGVVEKVRG